MDYVDFDSLAQKLAPTLQVLENKRRELLRKGRSEGLIYAAVFLVVGVITLLILIIGRNLWSDSYCCYFCNHFYYLYQ